MKEKLIKLNIVFLMMLFGFNQSNCQIYYGGGMSFNSSSDFKAIGLTGKIGTDISEKFDINGNVTYFIATKATFSFDFDAQYRLINIDDKLIINPMAGINFTKTDLINNSLSLGLSLKVPTEKYTYYAEPRWILDNSRFVITVGVIFNYGNY